MTTTSVSMQTKAAIIEATGELFADYRFASMTARQVAAAAGVSLSSIPYHFQTMEHLYGCAVFEAGKIASKADELIEEPLRAVRLAVEYGGLKTDQSKKFQELERENARLKKLLAKAHLDKAMFLEVASGDF